jgi:hypothetical protein
MNISKIIKYACLTLAVGLVIASCQKMERPPLTNLILDPPPPPYNPVKTFFAFENNAGDSGEAKTPTIPTNITYVTGITGMAASFGTDGYITEKTISDSITKFSNFTVAFWLKKDGPNAKGAGSAFAFGLATAKDIWTDMELFLEFEDAGNPSSADSAAAKFYLNDQWFEFTKTTAADKRLPKLLDNQWHHLAFVFDSASSMLTTYIDGAAYTNLPENFGKFTNNSGKIDFTKAVGLVVGGPGHYANNKTPDTWMGNFNGALDQFRIYATALSASEVNTLYTSKQ